MSGTLDLLDYSCLVRSEVEILLGLRKDTPQGLLQNRLI